MVAYLNELSLPSFNSAIEVINAFDQFGKTYEIARAAGIREVKIQGSFYLYEFFPHYSFSDWLKDNRADGDLRTLFKSVFGTVPFVDEIFENYQQQNDIPLEMTCQGERCIGLGLSCDRLFNTVAFSFDDMNWRLPSYSISINLIKEDDAGDLIVVTEEAWAKNIAIIENLAIHEKFIAERIALNISDGGYLWANREELFPNLMFCASVRSQIENVSLRDEEFQQVIKHLFDLQKAAMLFDGNPIKPQNFPTKASPESQSRIDKYQKELNIICPDDFVRLFSWHLRYTPGAGRIHFFPFENRNQILVGYIGKKIL